MVTECLLYGDRAPVGARKHRGGVWPRPLGVRGKLMAEPTEPQWHILRVPSKTESGGGGGEMQLPATQQGQRRALGLRADPSKESDKLR